MAVNSVYQLYQHEVLIMEDSLPRLKLLTDILSGYGFNECPASSGRIGLQSVETDIPELILVNMGFKKIHNLFRLYLLIYSEEKSLSGKSTDIHKSKKLIVDDSTENFRLPGNMLTGQGQSVHPFPDGKPASQPTQSTPPGLKKLNLMIFCLLIWAIPAFAEISFHFRHISTNDGLSTNKVFQFLQDRHGFLWIATQDGLNRYDGYKFKIYYHDPLNPSSISNSNVSTICEYNGTIWAGTWGGGLNQYLGNNQFKRYYHADSTGLSSDYIQNLYRDSKNNLWIVTVKGVDKYDPEMNSFKNIISKRAFVIREDNSGIIYIGTLSGLLVIDPGTNKIEVYEVPFNQQSNTINNCMIDHQDNIWVATNRGVYQFNKTSGEFIKVKGLEPLEKISVWTILEDSEHNLWFGSISGGLYCFQRSRHQLISVATNKNVPGAFIADRIWNIFEDRTNILWIATDGDGIKTLDLKPEKFKHYNHIFCEPKSLSHNFVQSFYEDQNNVLWIGTQHDLNRYENGSFELIKLPKNEISGYSYSITTICRAPKGRLWLGTSFMGLLIYNPENKKLHSVKDIPRYPTELGVRIIFDCFCDRSGNTWFCSSIGLWKYDIQADIFSAYSSAQGTKFPDDCIRTGLEDEYGMLWLGSPLGGLYRFDPATKQLICFTYDKNDTNSISGNYIVSIAQTTKYVWAGTLSGLNRIDKKDFSIRRCKGLGDYAINSIIIDKNQKFWIGTNSGLVMFDPISEKITVYDKDDGLQGNIFNPLAAFINKKGIIFMGGDNGFNSFDPMKIENNEYVPPIVITSFKVFDDERYFDKDISEVAEIRLDHSENRIAFGFAALDFTSPISNKYKYKLEGFDPSWISADERRTASYTNLDPGSYQFRVIGSNNDDVWNEQGVAIKLIIIPPYWQTWWFRGGLLLLIAASVYTGFKLRLMKAKEQNKLLENLVYNRTLQLKAANKELEAFAYSVSHDLRAPLRSIDGFSQILSEGYIEKLDPRGQDSLNRIRKAAQRMSQLIDDMLKLSRVTRSEMNIQEINLSDLVKEIAGNYQNPEAGRKVEFTIQDNIVVKADKHLMQIVIDNLIGNAWKYTSKRPAALIEFGMKQQNENMVYFVRDNGAGFDMNYANKLFGAFQRLHDSTEFTGTGIGLATVQRIIHRHGGKVWAEGIVEKGATFYFILP